MGKREEECEARIKGTEKEKDIGDFVSLSMISGCYTCHQGIQIKNTGDKAINGPKKDTQ